MDEKDWKILQTIHKERNITKASERLYISQPALTYRIKQLEETLNVKILIRGKKGVDFTAEGEYLVQYANAMLANLVKMKEHLENMDNKIKGTLRLGVSSIFARYELPMILSDFLKIHPDIDIVLKTGWSIEMNQMMHKEEAHVGIVRGNYNWQGKRYLLDEEKIYVVSKHEIELTELPKLPRIFYETDHSLMTLIDSWWEEKFDAPPHYTMEVDRIDTCREMVINGLGFAILPGICIKGFNHLHKIEISSIYNNDVSRKTWLIYRENALELSTVKAFVDFIQKRYAKKGYSNNE
ncbi:LysR family transcriptional regulator [Bacillus massiliglaciei]|uniref:LysR family transcriptional regulator n=1 Tax=Bacillus massiliglaciei TaxID=1816693 RepID=UPI000A9DA59C|nr:LysR family transcriptional regulator [Bacillus massiliglaciei]